jgi:methyl-accepting chemotaxis protein
MQMSGLTGLKVIELAGGTYAAPALPDGGTILEGEGTLDRLQRQAESVAEQSTELLKRANHIVDNLVQLTDPQRFAVFDDVVERARVTAGNLAAASASMRAMIEDNRVVLREAVGSVRDTAAGAGEVVAQVKSLVQANSGPVRAAVFDLRQASRSLKELARELRQSPSRLLFSRAPDERKLP